MKKSFQQFRVDIHKYKLSLMHLLNDELLEHYYKYQANGCGAKNGRKFPNTMWGVDVQSACHCHDISWHLSTCYQDLVDADDKFPADLKRITDYHSNVFTSWVRRLRIATYSWGVDRVGLEVYATERGFELPEDSIFD